MHYCAISRILLENGLKYNIIIYRNNFQDNLSSRPTKAAYK